MFKLISPVQDISICLRCQYRLSLRRKPRHGRRRYAEDPQQLRSFTSGASSLQLPSSTHKAATDDHDLGIAPIRYSTETPQFDRNYGYIKELSNKGRLGLNVLGEPAEVLLLGDRQKRFQLDSAMAKVHATGPDKNPEPEPISSIEMLEKMDAERGTVDFKQARQNIERVRKSWAAQAKGSITEDRYNDLVSRLHVGFTRPQLVDYLEKAVKSRASPDLFDLTFKSYGGLYARSSWQPLGTTPSGKHRAPRLGSPQSRPNIVKEIGQGLSKDALVKLIVWQFWKIRTISQESSLGELDIRLGHRSIRLIVNHKRDILKLMSRSYDSKVEAWPDDHIIRITADYDNCVDIVKLLVHTLENIKLSKLHLDVGSMSQKDLTVRSKELGQDMISQIEQYINALIYPFHGALHVFYLGPDDVDFLETQRVVYQILRPVSTQVSKPVWSQGDKPPNASRVPVIVGSRLPILNRKQKWARWCSPHGIRESASSPSAHGATQAVHGKLAMNTVKTFFGKPNNTSYNICSNNTPYWTQEIEYHDSVTFGQVLFHVPDAQVIAKPQGDKVQEEVQEDTVEKSHKKRKTNKRSKSIDTRDIAYKHLREQREFMPLVPGLLQSLESVGPLKKSEEYLKVRLSPSSKNVSLPVPVKALPDLEIRMSFDDKRKTTSIKNIRLVTRTEKDFLQPQNVVDLHFIRRQCVYANTEVDPQIQSFVGNSNFNIWGTERLKTPLGLSLSIPALAVQAHHGFDPKAHETLLVDYISLGLEHRSSLTIPYQDPESWPTLTYTNIEAGRLGGRRDELSLHSLRFVSEQQPSTITDPEPSTVDTETDSLSEHDHAAILFQKTAALIEAIEQTGHESSRKQKMPEAKRWRFGRTTKPWIRKIDLSFSPPLNPTRKRFVLDQSASPVMRQAEGR